MRFFWGSVVVASLGLGVAVTAWAQSDDEDDGGGFLERLIEDNLSGAGRDVRIRGFAGALSSEATLDELTIADENGVWLTLRGATLDWNRSALLRGRLDVNELSAEEILLPRLPQGQDQVDVPAAEATPFSLPDLPVSIAVDQILAERVALGEALFGAEAEVSLDGSMSLADGEGNAALAIERIDGSEGALTLDASYENSDRVLALDLGLQEGADGIAANLLGLPGRPSVELSVRGEGPLSDFLADIALATDGQDRLTGQVELTQNGEGDDATQGFNATLGGDLAPVFAPQYRPFFGPDIRLEAAGQTLPGGGFTLEQLDLTAQALTLSGRVDIGANGLPDLIDVTGEISSDDGSAVLLPVAGGQTQVGSVDLSVQFDASQSEDWTSDITVRALDLADLDIAETRLQGTGQIVEEPGGARAVSANIDFAATGFDARDPGVQQALGESAEGRITLDWETGAPVRIDTIELTGRSFDLQGRAAVDGTGSDGTVATLEATLNAEDFAAFSGLAGRDLGGSGRVQLDAEVTPRDGGFDIALDGATTDLRVGQAQADALLSGQTVLTVRAERDANGTRIPTLTVTNPAVDLTASGELTSTASNLRANVTMPESAVLDPALSGPAAAVIVATRAADAWDYTAEITAPETRINSSGTYAGLSDDVQRFTTETRFATADIRPYAGVAGRDLDGAADLTVSGFVTTDLTEADMALQGTLEDLRVGDARIDPVLIGRTELDTRVLRDGGTVTVERLSLNGRGIGLRVSGNGRAEDVGTEGASPSITADLELSADNLAPFSGLAGRDLGGALDADVDGTLRLDLQQIDARITATGRSLRTGMAAIDPILDGLVELSADASRNGENATIRALSLSAAAPGVRLEGTGSASDLSGTPRVTADAKLSVDRLAPFSALAGRDLAGALDADVEGSARIDGSEVDATVKATGRSLQTGMAEIDPILAGVLELDADVVRTGDTVSVNRLSLNAAGPGLRVDGSGTVTGLTSAAPEVETDTTVALDDLSAFSGLAGRDLAGALDLKVDGAVKSDLSVLDVVVDGTARSVRIGQENADRLLRGVTEIGLTARRDGETVNLPRLRVVNPQIRAEADGRYAAGESALRADVTIADLSDLDARMRGTADINLFAEETGEVWQVSLDGEAADAVIEAMAEVRDALSGNPAIDGSARIDAQDLSRFAPLLNRPLNGSLNATAEGSLVADLSQFDLTADVTGSNLRTGIAQADRILGSRAQAQIAATRRAGSDAIEVRRLNVETPMLTANANGSVLGGGSDLTFGARLADIGAYVDGFNGPVSAEGRVTQSGSDLGLNVTGTGPGGITLRADGTVAQDFSRANLDLSGRAPLGLADRFISPRSITGTLNYDLSVNGPLALSSLRGTLSATNARAVVPNLAIVLDDIALNANIANSSVQLDVQARKQAGGQIRVTGPIALTGGLNADLQVALAGLVFEDPRLYRTTLGGEVSIAGPLTGGARIGGQIVLGETELRIPSTGLGATGPIPDGLVHVNEPAAVRATRARAGLIEESGGSGGGGGGGGRAFPLDVTIIAENRIFLRGRGLDTELGGRLQLGGTTANVIPSGQFELIRGRLDLLGKRLTMDEGRIILQGDFTPFIRLVASTDAGETTVLIVIEGAALSPDISFRSDPELPEDEVLARLLFGKSISSISPLQAAQLASAVATLAGKGGGGVVSKLRSGFGLDDLDITTDEDGNAGVRAGAYLSENIYSDVEVDADGEAQINLNLDLTDSLTVRGGTSNTGETSLGIFFERDY